MSAHDSHAAPDKAGLVLTPEVVANPNLVPAQLDASVGTTTVSRDVHQAGASVYLVEIAKGLAITAGHVAKNLVGYRPMPTVHYPEEKRAVPEGYRGKHRLTLREDGSSKCVACMMCATACPAECIHIVPTESENPDVERYPERFDIDLLECVFCGLCVEACPVDAIRMDSGVYSLTAFDRDSFLVTKEELMAVQPDPSPAGKVV